MLSRIFWSWLILGVKSSSRLRCDPSREYDAIQSPEWYLKLELEELHRQVLLDRVHRRTWVHPKIFRVIIRVNIRVTIRVLRQLEVQSPADSASNTILNIYTERLRSMCSYLRLETWAKSAWSSSRLNSRCIKKVIPELMFWQPPVSYASARNLIICDCASCRRSEETGCVWEG